MNCVHGRWTIFALVLLAGCDRPTPAPLSPAAPQSQSQSLPPPPPPPGLAPAAPAAPAETPRVPASSAGASAAAPPVRLSAGVALAQTGPEGTMMGFSVDYRFVTGGPLPSRAYFWVIHVGGQPSLKSPVSLQARGTLADFVQGLRPENGPFACHLEDDSGRRVSDVEPMR